MDKENVISETTDIKSNKSSKILVGLLIAITAVIIIGAVLFLTVLKPTPKKVFDTAIDESFKFISNSYTLDYNTIKSNGNFNYKIDLEDEAYKDILDVINGFSFEYSAELDYQNKVSNVDINTKYNGEDFIVADMSMYDNSIFANIKNVTNGYLKQEVDLDEIFNDSNKKDIQTALNSIEKAMKNSIKDKYLSRNKETIIINNKKMDVAVNTLTINKDNIVSIRKDFIETLKNDKDFMALLKDENKLDEILKEDVSFENEIKISIYTRGIIEKFVGIKISSEDALVSVINDSNNNYSLVITNEGKEILSGTIALSIKENKSSKASSMKINIDIKDICKIELSLNSNSVFNDKISKKEINNTVVMDEDIDILSSLRLNKGFDEFYGKIEQIIFSMINIDDDADVNSNVTL